MSNSQTQQLPLLGASTSIKRLEHNLDWFMTGNRDVELTDTVLTAIYDNDFEHLKGMYNEDSPWTLEGWKTLANRANQMLTGYTGRIGIHGPFVDIPTFVLDKKISEVTSLRFNQALEFAAEVGATQMVVHSPWEFFGGAHVPHSGDGDRSMVIGRVHRLFDRVLPNAKAANCEIVIETIFDKRTGPLIELVRSFDSPLVRLSIDFGHTYLMQQAGGPPPDQWVRDAGDLLAHTHIQDNDGLSDRHWPAGRGNVNWYAVFNALKELDIMPRLILETGDYQWVADHFQNEGFAR